MGLIFAHTAIIAQLDPVTIEAGDFYDDDFGEVKKVDGDADGIGETQRKEKASVSVPVQMETDQFELRRMVAGGDLPDSSVGLVVHRRDLNRLGFMSNGAPVFKKGDRLIEVQDKLGNVHTSFTRIPVYCTQVQPLRGTIGRMQNLWLILFADRARGANA